MEIEPTEEVRQRQAFEFLRANARNAHIAGDGLLVGLLCHTGLERLRLLAKESSLLLSFSEIAWVPILNLYWLVDPDERYALKHILEQLKRETEEDRLVGQWIDRYIILIEQPLVGDAQLSPEVKDFVWPHYFTERSPETEALVSHMVELAWFHGPNDGNWKELVKNWLKMAPVWTHHILNELKIRLEWQARLTAPSQPQALLSESSADKLRTHSDLAEIWLLHLHGRSSSVYELAERLAPSVSAESHRWRVLNDFVHLNGWNQKDVDSQHVRLARRRRLSEETPLLIFSDKREARLTETLAKLFRARSQGAASNRWNTYIIARLHELAALRVWDYGMWLTAIEAQGQASLEVVQWTDNEPELSSQGLVHAVRSFCMKAPDKDATVRHAINTLEFAPVGILMLLANDLLATYPRQKYQALQLLTEITDLFPSETWPPLAHWTISFSKESSEGRTNGQTLAPVKHWHWVLPVLPVESPVWGILQPEVLVMANSSICWRSEYGAFLKRWLVFAPVTLAREVAETMTVHIETASAECLVRAELLIEFEEWHPSINGIYTGRLLPKAQSLSETFILAEHLNSADLIARQAALRPRIISNIREAIVRATPPSNTKETIFSPAGNVELIKRWEIEDRSLLEELIAAVDSPNVLSDYIPWLLTTIQLLVANGPIEFAQLIEPHVAKWTQQLPRGRKLRGNEHGPLSIVQWSDENEEEIALMLGWLAFQLPRQCGEVSHAIVLMWARQMLILGKSGPLDMVIYASAVAALQSPLENAAQPLAIMETAILCLYSRMDHDPSAIQSLASSLRKLSSLIKLELSQMPASSSIDAFLVILARLVPNLAKSPRAALRASVATLTWQLKKCGRTEAWVTQLLEVIQGDRRAQVRFEAEGGWAVARANAAGEPTT